jgi:hypothetical protein
MQSAIFGHKQKSSKNCSPEAAGRAKNFLTKRNARQLLAEAQGAEEL